MVVVQKFFDGEWIDASSHTNQVDAEAQLTFYAGDGFEYRIKPSVEVPAE